MTQAPGPPGLPGSPGMPGPVPVCPRHPDRISYVRCQRCGNPTCPECQRPAAVGVQCVTCVAQAAAEQPRTHTVLGGRATRDNRPLVTMTIIAICVAVWILEQVDRSGFIFQNFALAPAIGRVEPWRFLTSAFLHGPLIHIGFNMFALWMLGGYLEPLLGRLRFLMLYLISALGGGIAYVLITPLDSRVGVVGASGAVFGLFGSIIILNRAMGRDTAGIWANLAINAVLPILYPQIAWEAHVGGFLTGMAVALAFARGRQSVQVAYGGAAAVTVLIVALGVARYAIGA